MSISNAGPAAAENAGTDESEVAEYSSTFEQADVVAQKQKLGARIPNTPRDLSNIISRIDPQHPQCHSFVQM